jgi:hypothetical protein
MTKSKDPEADAETTPIANAAPVSGTTGTPPAEASSRRLLFIAYGRDAIANAHKATTGAIGTMLAARPRLSRATILAASVALAAALGSLVGAYAGANLMRPADEPATVPTLTVNAFKGPFTQLSAEIAALKASIENGSRNTNAQFAKITERIERAEKAQAERKTVQVPLPVPAPGPTLAAVPDATGSIAPKQQDKPPVVAGWYLRDIFDGRALVESRSGLYEIGPGAPLPGLGRVETIKRQDGRWVVVTPKGLIVSER